MIPRDLYLLSKNQWYHGDDDDDNVDRDTFTGVPRSGWDGHLKVIQFSEKCSPFLDAHWAISITVASERSWLY